MSYKAVQKVRVKVPASTANLGPGFDSLGMALNLYAWIDMAITEQTTIDLIGDQMHGIPTDKTNLIYKVAQMVFQEAGVSHSRTAHLDVQRYSVNPRTGQQCVSNCWRSGWR